MRQSTRFVKVVDYIKTAKLFKCSFCSITIVRERRPAHCVFCKRNSLIRVDN